MELFIKKAKLTVLDKYEVTDKNGNKIAEVKGELISLGKRMRINDKDGHEQASVYEKKVTIRDKYMIDLKDGGQVQVFRIDTLRKVPEYRAKELGWTLRGDFSKKDLKIMEGLHTVAHIKPKRLSFGETLRMDLRKPEDALAAIALYIVSDLDQNSRPEGAEEK